MYRLFFALTPLSLASLLQDIGKQYSLQNAAAHLGLFCLLKEIFLKIDKFQNTPDAPKIENGFTLMIMMVESICH